jgi:hypothetical protein
MFLERPCLKTHKLMFMEWFSPNSKADVLEWPCLKTERLMFMAWPGLETQRLMFMEWLCLQTQRLMFMEWLGLRPVHAAPHATHGSPNKRSINSILATSLPEAASNSLPMM